MAEAVRRRTARLLGGRMAALVASRVADQAALGLGSLLLARELGPEAFAPVAMLFVVNSLAVQVADLGLGFAVLRLAEGERPGPLALRRVRRVNAVVAVAALAGGLVVGAGSGPTPGVVVATSGVLWLLAGEGYVRKAAGLKLHRVRMVARADIAGAAAFLVTVLAVAVVGAPLWLVPVAFVGKHLVELALVRGWAELFAADGERLRSGPEWLGQIMTYLVANVDYLLVGLLLGPTQLSLYVLAFRVASAVPALVATAFTQTTFLTMAAALDRDARQAAYAGQLRRLLPVGAGGSVLVLVAAPVLPVVLGSEWEQVAPLLVVMAVAVPWRLLLGLTIAQALTAGGARQVVGWEAGRLVVMAASVVAASAAGLVPVGAAVAAATVVTITVEHVLSCRVAGIDPDRRVVIGAVLAVAVSGVLGVALA